MNRGQNPDSDAQLPHPLFTNPDDYLSLGNDQHDNQPQPQHHIQTYPKPPEEQLLPQNQQPSEVQDKGQPGESSLDKIQISTQKKIAKQSKKIKKKQHSSEEERSNQDQKEPKKANSEGKNRGRKPKEAADSTRNRPKPRKKQKIDQVQQIKREVKDLMNIKETHPQEKPIEKDKFLTKRTVPVIEQSRIDYHQCVLPWRHGKQKEQDFNSVEAELSEQSIVRRSQSYTYRRLVELIAQQGENLLEQIAQLPPMLY